MEIVQTLILAGVFYGIVSLATARVVVEGPSMQPTLKSGEWIIVNRLTYTFGAPHRGDVVVFLPPTNATTDDLIKRIIGLPGETVEIHSGAVYVNGEQLEEPYIQGTTTHEGRWVLTSDQLFVMGDNRELSLDSRSFGPITLSIVVGKAWIIYWPPSEWGPLAWRNNASARNGETSSVPSRNGGLADIVLFWYRY